MRILQKTEFQRPKVLGQRSVGGDSPSVATPTTAEHLKLRKEFPFLGSSDCPMELKALVTDRISSYHAYQDSWPELFQATTPEECANVAGKVVKAYIDNRRTWEELNYYQQHHRILGHHPIFRQFSNLRKLRAMSIKELVRREERVRKNIWRVQSEMKKGDKPNLDQTRRDKIRGYEAELAEIRRMLGDQ